MPLKKEDLEQFIGTEHYHLHPSGLKFTDGVKYLIDNAGAYWLIDEICFYMMGNSKLREHRNFATWKLTVKDNKGLLICEDGNGNELARKKISYTDFCLDEVELWYEYDVILLPSEH